MAVIEENYFNLLPLELQSKITQDIKVGQARLICKTLLKANEIKFCKSINKINKNSICEYTNESNLPFAINVKIDSWLSYTYIFNESISNSRFVIKHDRKYYVEHVKTHFTEILHMGGLSIDLQSRYNILRNRNFFQAKINKSSLLCLKLGNCDNIIPHYAKNQIGFAHEKERLTMYSPSCNFLTLHRWLLTNAIVMGIRKMSDYKHNMILYNIYSHDLENQMNILKNECKTLFNDISVYIKKFN